MIYLSVCIPTYNRCKQLKKSIESIICQKAFISGDVEIVVSDNASTDGTQFMMEEYSKRYKKIIYSRNTENEGVSKNIYKSLMLANGEYRKISNDTFIYNSDSIDRIVKYIKIYIDNRPLLFFANSYLKDIPMIYVVKDVDSLLTKLSFQITSDVLHGYWKDDIKFLLDLDISKWFYTIRFVIERMFIKKSAVIVNERLLSIHEVNKKDLSYGLYNVFYIEQFNIYSEYLARHIISKSTYDYLEKDILFGFFIEWVINQKINKDKFIFNEYDDLDSLINITYNCKDYYKHYRRKLGFQIFIRHIKNLLSCVK
ncbi:glycosyltransferase family 2 protein [Treponema parvum]|uniref:Glycosyltransferase family 2 protein n=1 Tax=Treponema parvum TaxID=138851 RepID=A0A975F4K5_9SPIR|nr:glycosyltransferase family 2 protein [Treponema parvum]QTQ14524.1 glycosyltransferase family 2 protein [Treponema parvum]